MVVTTSTRLYRFQTFSDAAVPPDAAPPKIQSKVAGPFEHSVPTQVPRFWAGPLVMAEAFVRIPLMRVKNVPALRVVTLVQAGPRVALIVPESFQRKTS
jgi:hypothetical protein